MTILLIEDDVGIGRSVSQGLAAKGLAVKWLREAARALDVLAAGGIETVILDIGLPDADGMTLCREMRAQGHDMPVLMLTARTTLDDRLEGFHAGADDYLPKPFAFSELLARVGVLTRRAAQLRPTPVQWAGLVVDQLSGEAQWQGVPIALEPKSIAMLAVLARARGGLVSRRALVDAVWGSEAIITENAVDVAVSALRKRLAELGPDLSLRTVRGQGFQLEMAGLIL